jgi:uncharacterized membrane protein
MALGIVATLIAIAGIVYGIVKRHRTLTVASVFALMAVATVWINFYSNPH